MHGGWIHQVVHYSEEEEKLPFVLWAEAGAHGDG